jgi:hypothetical protein
MNPRKLKIEHQRENTRETRKTIQNLNKNVTCLIFQFLNVNDHVAMSKTCKFFGVYPKLAQSWPSRIYFDHRMICYPNMPYPIQLVQSWNCSNVVSLDFGSSSEDTRLSQNPEFVHQAIVAWSSSLEHIRHCRVPRWPKTVTFPHLKTLHFPNSPLTSSEFVNYIWPIPCLESLECPTFGCQTSVSALFKCARFLSTLKVLKFVIQPKHDYRSFDWRLTAMPQLELLECKFQHVFNFNSHYWTNFQATVGPLIDLERFPKLKHFSWTNTYENTVSGFLFDVPLASQLESLELTECMSRSLTTEPFISECASRKWNQLVPRNCTFPNLLQSHLVGVKQGP